MRTLYIVTYDVCDAKRLRRVFRLLRGYGDHLQLSVFRCELSDRERAELVQKLHDLIKHDEDQVLLFPLGPAEGFNVIHVVSIGLVYKPSIHEAYIF
ncbi:MAG: CRISPR-associated endonuclease Cas2 [Bacteroidota bacterium]|nr:CRISPR-associated endonuclease Cas2 [Bacteroidota bacterium]